MRLRISARKSDLARLQAYQVGNALSEKHLGLEITYNFRESLGDKNLTDPLWKMPEKGVFTEDFVQDLLDQRTDLVVHSWKDLPTSLRPGTKIVATLPRADQRDMLLFKKSSVEKVKTAKALKVFSSSPRRAYNLEKFLKVALPFSLQSVEFVNVRGNIQTRVRKLMDDTETDALVLAKAALDRLLSAEEPEFAETKTFLRECLQSLNWMVLPLSVNPNAAAQGALAVEVKDGRPEIEALLRKIQCQQTFISVMKERSVLSSYGGGCHQKIGVAILPRIYGEVFFLQGLTDAGELLSKATIQKSSDDGSSRFVGDQPLAKWKADELFNSRELKVERTSLPEVQIPPTQALWISKAEALPENYKFEGLLWSAGLKTWQKLAARGYWVHGSAEGLGEEEDPRIDRLADTTVLWTKLTHTAVVTEEQAIQRPAFIKNVVATYQVTVQAEAFKPEGKKCFFWHSGSQFLAALKRSDELKMNLSGNAIHACGPGATYKVLRQHLGPEASIQIFLNEEEWRTSCSQ